MTFAGSDTTVMWLKQVPKETPDSDGIWTTRLMEGHRTVRRSRQPDFGSVCACTNCESPGLFLPGDLPGGLPQNSKRAVWPLLDGTTLCTNCAPERKPTKSRGLRA